MRRDRENSRAAVRLHKRFHAVACAQVLRENFVGLLRSAVKIYAQAAADRQIGAGDFHVVRDRFRNVGPRAVQQDLRASGRASAGAR